MILVRTDEDGDMSGERALHWPFLAIDGVAVVKTRRLLGRTWCETAELPGRRDRLCALHASSCSIALLALPRYTLDIDDLYVRLVMHSQPL